jgi:hypothetical protein
MDIFHEQVRFLAGLGCLRCRRASRLAYRTEADDPARFVGELLNVQDGQMVVFVALNPAICRMELVDV